MNPSNESERVFEGQSRGASPGKLTAGGIACLGTLPLTLLAAIYLKIGFVPMILLSVFFGLTGVGLLLRAAMVRKMPRSVSVGPEALTLVSTTGETSRFNWNDIGWIAVETILHSTSRKAMVYSPTGKKLFEVGDSLQAFDEFVTAVNLYLARKDSGTTSQIALKKARKAGTLLVALGLPMVAIGVLNFFLAIHERRAEELYRTKATPASAKVIDRRTAPDGVTKRIVFLAAGDNGKTAERNVEVLPEVWNAVKIGDDLPILVVPEDPEISHLLLGEVEDSMKHNPNMMLVISIIMSAFSLSCVLYGLLQLTGRELVARGGLPSVRRVGEEL